MTDLLRYFRSHWRELLIAGVWLQSVVSAAFSGSWLVFALTTFGGLALLVLVFVAVDLWQRRRRPIYGASEAFLVPRRAVVLTIGRQKETILFALQAQKPDWLGLICTRQTEEVADEVVTTLGLEGQQVCRETVDPWSVVEVRAKTAFILDWLARQGVARGEVVVDITGGTAIMSAGAFSMATERQIDSQYVRSDYGDDNRPVPGSQRGVFVARFEEKADDA